jgi:hypothetical protein
VRVMRTGLHGGGVGMAARVCRDRDTDPRGVFAKHLGDLQASCARGRSEKRRQGRLRESGRAPPGSGSGAPEPSGGWRPPGRCGLVRRRRGFRKSRPNGPLRRRC